MKKVLSIKYKVSRSSGFTLIELIVVVGLIGILGFIFSDVLSQTLRGQNKVRVINQVKQNGQVALEKISNDIRDADKVICVGKNPNNNVPSGANDTLVVFKKGNFTRYRFYPPNFAKTPANGYIAVDTFNIGDFGTSTTPDQYCTLNFQFNNTSNTLTDSDTFNGVSIDYDSNNPIFGLVNPTQSAGFNDIITVTFRGFPGVQSGATYENLVKEGGVLFTTSISTGGK